MADFSLGKFIGGIIGGPQLAYDEMRREQEIAQRQRLIDQQVSAIRNRGMEGGMSPPLLGDAGPRGGLLSAEPQLADALAMARQASAPQAPVQPQNAMYSPEEMKYIQQTADALKMDVASGGRLGGKWGGVLGGMSGKQVVGTPQMAADGFYYITRPDGTMQRATDSEGTPVQWRRNVQYITDAFGNQIPVDKNVAIGPQAPAPVPPQAGGPVTFEETPIGIVETGKSDIKMREEARKSLDERQAALNKQSDLLSDADRFLYLNQTTTTGGASNIPGVGAVRGAIDPDYKEMESLMSRIIPKMREPGSGTTSDFDAKMFQSAAFGVDKPYETNANIVTGWKTSLGDKQAKLDFERWHLDTMGTLKGANEKWKQYLNANPIFDEGAEKGSYKFNPNRVSWEQYFKHSGKRDFFTEYGIQQ